MKLEWKENGKNEWLAGDLARITLRTQEYRKAKPNYYTYLDGSYLGCEHSLDDAKERIKSGSFKEGCLLDEWLPGGLPAFLKLTVEERRRAWREYDNQRRERYQATTTNVITRGIMTKYSEMNDDQLLRAYNETVEVARSKGLERYKPLDRFSERDLMLKTIEHMESAVRAMKEGEKVDKKKRASGAEPEAKPRGVTSPAPKANPISVKAKKGAAAKKAAPAPAPAAKAAGKEKAAPKSAPAAKAASEPRTGKLGAFLDSLKIRAGTFRETVAICLFESLGKMIEISAVNKKVYGKADAPAIVNVLKGLEVMLRANKSPYEVRRKEKTIGLFPTGKS